MEEKNNLFPEGEDFSMYEVEEADKYDETDRKSYYFDFEKGDFVTNYDGTIKRCDENRAFLQWCWKSLLTVRFSKLSYPDYYGSELTSLINSDLSRKAIELEIERMVKDTLFVHPKTYDVVDFKFIWKDDYVLDTFTVIDVNQIEHNLEHKIKY